MKVLEDLRCHEVKLQVFFASEQSRLLVRPIGNGGGMHAVASDLTGRRKNLLEAWEQDFCPGVSRPDRPAPDRPARRRGRLKDFRRFARRYDHSANNYFAAVCLASTACEWL